MVINPTERRSVMLSTTVLNIKSGAFPLLSTVVLKFEF
jgi:hypothetical protein